MQCDKSQDDQANNIRDNNKRYIHVKITELMKSKDTTYTATEKRE